MWSEALRSAVDHWAAAHPMQPGMPRRAAVERVGLPDGALLDLLVVASEHLVVDARGVHRRGVAPMLPAAVDQQLHQLFDRFDADPFGAPEVAELEEAGLTERVLAIVVGDGRLLRIAAGVYLPPGSIEQEAQRVRALAQPFTASQARQAWGTTRRVAVPLLEDLDAAGVTQRVDDQRRASGTAEVDGNRTRQTEVLGLVGFEDRGAHQDAYTSPGRTALANQPGPGGRQRHHLP
jgi:selenocysteine-specific elongation factor